MKKYKSLPVVFFLLIAAIAAGACSSGRSTPIVPTVGFPTTQPEATPTGAAPTELPSATSAPAVPPTATAAGMHEISLDQVKNREYSLPTNQKVVRLKNGKYIAGSGADFLSANLLDQLALGDLDGDGKLDAAVLLAENSGGTGVFVSLLALLNRPGDLQQAGAALVDDRPQIKGLQIEDGKIILEAVIHGVNDPMCCPSFPVTEIFSLGKNGLILRRVESITPIGGQRAINITGPADGAQVPRTLQLQGNVTIAPFENNLVYRIYDQEGNLLAEGPLMVAAANPGDPGTFDAAIDLSAVPAGVLARLAVLDLSPADGATLAMDSIEIVSSAK
jgi:hypothetical protein